MNPSAGTPLMVIAPHFDDAVLGCGQWLAQCPGAVVLTVFAAVPADFAGVTEWDAACGFDSSVRAVEARRAEDDAALALLAARPLRLAFCDAQYRRPATVQQLASALGEAIAAQRPACLALPLGLFHSDHVLAREAALRAGRLIDIPLVIYEDGLYRRLDGAVDEALAAVRAQGYDVGPPVERQAPETLALKRRALACYASQLIGLSTPGRLGYADALEPERYRPLRRAIRSEAA